MYYVNVPVSLSYEADKNGGEVADCGGEISFCFHLKKRARIRNQMRARFNLNVGLSFKYLLNASQRAK